MGDPVRALMQQTRSRRGVSYVRAATMGAAMLTGLAGVSAGASDFSSRSQLVAEATFPSENPCPIEGDGGDPSLNVQKNRYEPPEAADFNREITTPAGLIALPSPQSLPRIRAKWPQSTLEVIAARENQAATVEGYLVRAIKENTGKGESCNCHDPKVLFDYHLYIADEPGVPIGKAVVVEMTPRWRAAEPSWGTVDNGYSGFKTINALIDKRVRVTGWILFDQEHLSQARPGPNQWRATAWEIHPITMFEYQQNGTWTEL